ILSDLVSPKISCHLVCHSHINPRDASCPTSCLQKFVSHLHSNPCDASCLQKFVSHSQSNPCHVSFLHSDPCDASCHVVQKCLVSPKKCSPTEGWSPPAQETWGRGVVPNLQVL